MRSPLSHLSLSLSSQERCSSHISIFVALLWTHSRSSLSLLSCGAQNWAQNSRCDLSRAEQRGRITSLHLLPVLILVHPRIPLALLATRTQCELMDISLSSRTPRSFSAELLAAGLPILYWCRLFLPRCRTLHSPLLNFRWFFSAHLCQGPSEGLHSTLRYQPLLPALCCQGNC